MKFSVYTTGNAGLPCVSRNITWVNINNITYEAKFRSENVRENENKIDETYHVASSCCP